MNYHKWKFGYRLYDGKEVITAIRITARPHCTGQWRTLNKLIDSDTNVKEIFYSNLREYGSKTKEQAKYDLRAQAWHDKHIESTLH